MEAVEIIDVSPTSPVFTPIPAARVTDENPALTAISMRALRRKARRISAYARFSVEALNALAAEMESDIAALQH